MRPICGPSVQLMILQPIHTSYHITPSVRYPCNDPLFWEGPGQNNSVIQSNSLTYVMFVPQGRGRAASSRSPTGTSSRIRTISSEPGRPPSPSSSPTSSPLEPPCAENPNTIRSSGCMLAKSRRWTMLRRCYLVGVYLVRG